MAEIALYKIEFLTSGQWDEGDIVEIFHDTTDPDVFNSLLVYLNGSPLPGSNRSITTNVTGSKVEIFYNPQVCADTTLLVFARQGFFPYANISLLPNHSSCNVSNPNCDLVVVGSPTIIKPSSTIASDGSITITATSSNSIKYKLGSDFEYDDGTGQTSPTFSGLLPGTYRIYLRDENNCGANVLVVLPVNNDYGVRYRLEYDDIIGGETRVDILKRGYVGAITEVIGGGGNFSISLNGEGEVDKFLALAASSAVLKLESVVDQQFLDLYTNDRELYRINYYKNLSLKWTGKVLPQQYQEGYVAPPYEISVPATDGLSQLKDYILVQDDGQLLYGRISLVKLVAYILGRLNMPMPIRVACNLYAADMLQTDDDDPFDQAYCDYEAFYLSGEDPTLAYVLQAILEPFGARITQWDGRWNIVRVEEMTAVYDYRDFDSEGEYVSHGTFDPVIELNFPTLADSGEQMWAENNQSLEMRPGYGLLKVLYKLGLKPNILRNGDFRLKAVFDEVTNQYSFAINKDGFTLVNGGYSIAELYEVLEQDELGTNVAYVLQGGSIADSLTGSAYFQTDQYTVTMGTNNTLKIKIRYKLPLVAVIAGSTAFYADLPYIKVRMVVRYAASGYLKQDGTWAVTPQEIVFYANQYGEYIESEIIAQSPAGIFTGASTTGLPFSVKVYHAYAFHADFDDLNTFNNLQTLFLGEGTRRTFRSDDYFTSDVYPDKLYYYELENNTEAEDIPNIIRPDDYLDDSGDPDHNPKQWVLKSKISVTPYANADITFWIDTISAEFLTDGKTPIDTILRSKTAELNNPEEYEKNLVIGSYSSLIVSETYLDTRFSFAVPGAEPIKVTVVTNALSAALIYAGYLSDADGVGYENWTRDGIAELDKLHGILLASMAAQYSAPWRLMRGSIISKTTQFGLLNVIKEVQASNRIYLPIGITLDDKRNIWNGEFHELRPAVGGSDGGGGGPYSSAFSTGFGQSGFN